MKLLILVPICLFVLFNYNQVNKKNSSPGKDTNSSVNTGIAFFNGTWPGALAEATKQHKPIFVDAYAVWCSPCKMMEQTVFPLPEVAKYYNEHFVSYRMDIEKGDGIAFKKKYTITGYPSFLFFNEDGSFAHHTQGTNGINTSTGFIAMAKEAFDPELALSSLKKRYDDGNREEEFLLKYLLAKLRAYHFTENCKTEMEEYIKLHPVPLVVNVVNWTFIKSFITDIKHPYFIELQKRKTDFARVSSTTDVNRKIYTTEMDYYLEKEDWKSYTASAVNLMEKVSPVDIWYVNDIAWKFWEHVDDEKNLNKAKSWIQKAIEQETHYEFYDTYSHVLFKTGDKHKAIEMARMAIELANKEESDITELEKWLKLIL